MSNTFIKFIDSCVGAIARKVQDEFDESKHPRDKGGRFSSKGGEGRGEGGLHHAGKDVEKYGKDLEAKHNETVEKQKARRGASELEETDFEKEAKEELNGKKGDEAERTSTVELPWGSGDDEETLAMAEEYGLNAKFKSGKGRDTSRHLVLSGDPQKIREMVIAGYGGDEKFARHMAPQAFRAEGSEGEPESDGASTDISGSLLNEIKWNYPADASKVVNRVQTLLEDPRGYSTEDILSDIEHYYGKLTNSARTQLKEYLNERGSEGDDDVVPSLEQYKENVRENLDGDDNNAEDYGLEARYDRAKFHSDQFKKLKNGEFITNPDRERRLKNYYRRLGMKKPEDAFKVWWDI